MPPKPTAPASKVSQTWGLAKAVSSRRPDALASPGHRGTKASASATVTSDSAAAAQ